MPRQSKGPADQNAPPSSYPQLPPPSASNDAWVITAINKMEGTLGRLEASAAAVQAQLTRIETKLLEVEKEVIGHGKWMHTLKAFATVILIMMGWVFANAAWPWLKSKIGIPAATP